MDMKKEIKEFSTWAHKSWTIWFNTIAALIGIFADNISQLSGVVEQKLYATLAIIVPMANYLLRMKTQKQKGKSGNEGL